VFDHVVMNKCLKSQEMTNLVSKYKGRKDILFDFFNIGDTLNIKVSERKSYNVQSELIESIELCKIDFNYKEVENTLSLDQSVFLLMPSKDEFQENQYFSFRKEFFDTMLETITDTEVECYFSEPNRAYLFPIDAIDYKKTLPVEKTKQQKLSKKDLEQIAELEDLKDVLEPIANEKPQIGQIVDFGEGLEKITRIVKVRDGREFIEAKKVDGSDNRLNLYDLSDWNEILSNQEKYKSLTETKKAEQKERDLIVEAKAKNELERQKEYNDIDGFYDDKTALQRSKVLKYLNSNFGKTKVKNEIRQAVFESNAYVYIDNEGNKTIRYIENDNIYVLPDKLQTKTAIDYADYLINVRDSQKVEPNELQEAIETLEMLMQTAKGKDKKDIKEALEIIKMLNENN